MKKCLNILFIILATAFLLNCSYIEVLRRFTSRIIDFKRFYDAALAVINHTDIYTAGIGGYIYPPFLAFLITPITYFSVNSAIIIWLGINLALIVTILWLGFKTLARNFDFKVTKLQAVGACSLAILLSYDPILSELILGQTDTLILAGFALALYIIDRWPVGAGWVLGATANIKYQALFFLPFFLLRARFRAALGLLAGTIVFALLPATLIGWNTNLHYWGVALRGLINMTNNQSIPAGFAASVPKTDWVLNITIGSGLHRLITGHDYTQIDFFFALSAILILTAIVFGYIFRRFDIPFFWRPQARQNPHTERVVFNLEWYALFNCMLIFAPQNTVRHLFLMLTTYLLAVLFLMSPKVTVNRWTLWIAILIAQAGIIFPPGNYSYWRYLGGPCWSLLPLIITITWYGLSFAAKPVRSLIFSPIIAGKQDQHCQNF